MTHHCLFFSLTGKRWERTLWSHRVATFLRMNDWDSEVIDFTAFWKLEELQELVSSRTSTTRVGAFALIVEHSNVLFWDCVS